VDEVWRVLSGNVTTRITGTGVLKITMHKIIGTMFFEEAVNNLWRTLKNRTYVNNPQSLQ
jgi:hypothetical protein